MGNGFAYGPPVGNRLRVFTWPVHGSYFYYLSHANCDFYVPVRSDPSGGYGGIGKGYAWRGNVFEIPVEDLPNYDFDVILFQWRTHYEYDQYEIFTESQRRTPKIFLEHDPPREHPTDTRHIVDDPSVVLVHVTDFNRLMWDSNGVPSTVIDHGVPEPSVRYDGSLERGIVVINNLQSRGRRLGLDIFEYCRKHVPLDLVGMGAKDIGGLGEISHDELPAFTAQYRFFFNPIRYTSLGLAIIEAMLVGLPVVGLATTELISVIRSGVNGFVSLQPDELVKAMKTLLESPDLARSLGENGRQTALERFSINRFARDWEALFELVARGERPSPYLQPSAVSYWIEAGK